MHKPFQQDCQITADHPSAPGHFPGAPLVPGVMLLDEVIAAARDWLGTPAGAVRIEQCKFLRPIDFGSQFRIELRQPKPGQCQFTLLLAGEIAASGRLTLRA